MPVRVKATSGQPALTRIEVFARDGADAPVCYKFDQPQQTGDSGTDEKSYEVLVRLGHRVSQIGVKAFAGDNLVDELQVPIRQQNLLESIQPLTLVLGGGTEIQNSLKTKVASFSGEVAPVSIRMSADQFPVDALGLNAVQAIVIAVGNDSAVVDLNELQQQAISKWLHSGGRLVISAKVDAVERLLAKDSWVGKFVPGTIEGVRQLTNSSRLESFVNSREQLIGVGGSPIDHLQVTAVDGVVLVADSKKQPLVVKKAVGFGEVVFSTIDLNHPQLTGWKSYSSLVQTLVAGAKSTQVENRQSIASVGGASAEIGFSDLVGQMFAPLEQFSKVQFIPFTAIAILIALYILCIGPLDYYLLRRLFGRMELTWITFPLFSILFCGIAWGISTWSRPAQLQTNQLEIIDVDAVSGRCRGSVWANLYSPSGHNLDVEFAPHALGFKQDESVLSWHALPGGKMGGMNVRSSSNVSVQEYRQSFGRSSADGSRSAVHVDLEDFPVQVSSSRALFGSWGGSFPGGSKGIRSNLVFQQKSQSIAGTLKNPFDFELTNCRVYHGNWAYLLDAPLGPGEPLNLRAESSERPLRAMLNRLEVEEEKDDNNRNHRSQSKRWEVSGVNISRIAEMMMFYDAAGGKGYTGLTHGYQSFIDFSEPLHLNRAILVGEIVQRGADLKITSDGKPIDNELDQVTTMVRVLLPVKVESKKQR